MRVELAAGEDERVAAALVWDRLCFGSNCFMISSSLVTIGVTGGGGTTFIRRRKGCGRSDDDNRLALRRSIVVIRCEVER